MFRPGDVVVGVGGSYAYTGAGSVCKVLSEEMDGRMRVQVLLSAPTGGYEGTTHMVSSVFFRLQEKPPSAPMKIESLKFFLCQQENSAGEACGEIAGHRVTVPGISVTLCDPHAQAYIRGEKRLTPILCARCKKICKPGYVRSESYGIPFCDAACEGGESTAQTYAPAFRTY